MVYDGEGTRRAILDAGVTLARSTSLDAISAREIGEAADVPHTLVFYHFYNMARLRDAIADHAIAANDGAVIARLIVEGHASVAGWSRRRRARYLTAAL